MPDSLAINLDESLKIHQQSMMNSLCHRLEVARAKNNAGLVEQLEQEKQDLALNPGRQNALHALIAVLQAAQKGLERLLFGSSALQVNEFDVGSDHWWYAFDPQTGECVYADSDVELRLWIEQNYQGK